jgi:uridine kinase
MHLIGIAGPSGSGKTELAQALARLLTAPVVALDSYYRSLAQLSFEERERTNFDVPDALEHGLLVEHLSGLTAGRAVEVPVYDFTRHLRSGRTTRVESGEFVILEGLWALYWEDLRRLLGTKVYVETADDICFKRRLERDLRERGRSRESVLAQYTSTVHPMAVRHIVPTRRFADVVVSGVEPIEQSVEKVRAHLRR